MDKATYEKEFGKNDKLIDCTLHITDILYRMQKDKAFGGFEVKFEAGKVTFVKDWRGKKY